MLESKHQHPDFDTGAFASPALSGSESFSAVMLLDTSPAPIDPGNEIVMEAKLTRTEDLQSAVAAEDELVAARIPAEGVWATRRQTGGKDLLRDPPKA
ncbi:MAG: hypothetical protein L0Y57_14550 [Beijerinckiaceae bacterium]|nr:hypothetical protein [Beijerinckiaceae bacterium]